MAGRPGAAFTRLVRHAVDGGELAAIMYAFARGEPIVRHTDYQRKLHEARLQGLPDPERPGDAELVYPSVAEQQAAVRYLTEWGWQKPAERLEVGPAESELDLSALSDEELAAFEALARKASAGASG